MRLFTPLAVTYELINHVLTMGLDIVWRKKAVKDAVRGGGGRWLDLCTGTGEIASALASNDNGTRVFALDMNAAMLAQAVRKPSCRTVRFIQGDVYRLPFRDGSFDLVTMSFAARTLSTDPEKLLAVFGEIRRMIAHGGRFVMVDTSQPSNRLICLLFHSYVRILVCPVGGLISRDRNGYAYLAHTIPRFPGAETIAAVLGNAGFNQVTYRRMLFGAAAVHIGYVSSAMMDCLCEK